MYTAFRGAGKEMTVAKKGVFMRELLEQGYGIILIGAVAGVGVLCRWLLLFYYAGIGRACKAFNRTKNKTIAYIRNDLKMRKNANLGIKSAMIYTECRLAERRVTGVRLGVLEAVTEQSLLLVLLSGVLTAFSGVLSGCDNKQVFQHLFFCGTLTFLMIVLDLLTGFKEKHKRVRLFIRDYIENIWSFDGECAGAAEPLPEKEQKSRSKKERKAEKKSKAEKEGEEKKCKTAKIRKAEKKKERKFKQEDKKQRKEQKQLEKLSRKSSVNRKKRGKAQEEKRRLTEELLRERRQLEARHFAEQRCREREETVVKEIAVVTEECVVPAEPEESKERRKEQEQVREEAAAATETGATEAVEVTYETLLSEVLAEYLA